MDELHEKISVGNPFIYIIDHGQIDKLGVLEEKLDKLVLNILREANN